MKIKRIMSALLVAASVLGSMVIVTVPAGAEPITSSYVDDDGRKWANSDGTPVRDYPGSASSDSEEGKNDGNIFQSVQQKIESMIFVKEQNGYSIYYEPYTGEVVFLENATGAFFATNPYDINDLYNATPNGTINYNLSETVKKQLLSQIKLTYIDTQNNGKLVEMYSYEEAAERGQIMMKNTRDGIRVEYQIGEPAIQRLVPRLISAERYMELIYEPFLQAKEEITALYNQDPVTYRDDYNDVNTWFDRLTQNMTLYDPFAEGVSELEIKQMQNLFPITKTMAVYACDTSISPAELRRLEIRVKKYCPQYTYEEMAYDIQETGFVAKDQNPPRFTMALEYKVREDGKGIEVRLPANGISFDETLYQLQEITILPYMGSGSDQYKGYTFIPDGTGSIIRYEEFPKSDINISGKVYGDDNAYHEMTGGTSESMRLPVFGGVTNYTEYRNDTIKNASIKKPQYDFDMGYLAIITEGDSLATITARSEATHPYKNAYATFVPRPSDTYNLADSISVSGTDTEWTVTSSRRYTGSYTINYIMLSGDKGSGYEPTYYGMAEAYRDYLTNIGVLEKLETEGDMPLYIESFGSSVGTERVLSFPVEVDVPLTTFEDVKTMATGLKESGIEKINFKLTGFANGGLDSTVPYKLKWQKVLGGESGFEDLVSFSKENGVGLYPDFDLAYINRTDSFDGVSLKAHAVKTIDGRYSRQKTYDSGYQMFVQTHAIALSPSVYDRFYDKFESYYGDYDVGAISLSTLGSDLNSDFDEDDPYHREDSRKFTEETLSKANEQNGSVMVSGGNAYALKYADIITDMALTSSNYSRTSEMVPFAGIVLHGSRVFTGTPINMEGDIKEAILRSIENGAALLFTLSYQNTQSLKTSETWSRYYSIAYENWKEDVVKYYEMLNDAAGDLQDKYIVGHEFLEANRVKDEDEEAADAAALQEFIDGIVEELAEVNERHRLVNLRAEKRGEEPPYNDVVDPSTITAPEEDVEERRAELSEKYKTQRGTVVLVEYEGGTSFILNYNSYDITVEMNGQSYTVGAMDFYRLG